LQKDPRDDTHCCILGRMSLVSAITQWHRQDFVTGGSEVWVYRGLEYEVPQSRLYCLCINVALCSTALQCICRVKRRSSMTMKAHTYYIIFGRPPIGGSFPPGGAIAIMCTRTQSALHSLQNNLNYSVTRMCCCWCYSHYTLDCAKH